MPFDYVENVRASLASSIATDADEEIDGVEDARKSFNISSSAGGSEQLEADDSSQQETYDDADDSSEDSRARDDDGAGNDQLDSRHYRGEVDDTWKRWGSESRNSDASWSFASDTVDKARDHDNTGHRRQVTRDASSVGMGSDDEDQMVSSDDSVRAGMIVIKEIRMQR